MSRQQITTLDITNGTVASADLAAGLTIENFTFSQPGGAGMIKASQATTIFAAAQANHIGANAYIDSTGAWVRYDIAQPATLFIVRSAGAIETYYAAAGANPISWTRAGQRISNASDADTAWTSATLLNAFAHYGSPFGPAGYRKMADGTVVVRGLISGGSANAIAFTLPAGYRPATGRQYLFMVHNANGPVRIDVNDAGNILFGGMSIVGATYSTGWTSLDGIRFLAES